MSQDIEISFQRSFPDYREAFAAQTLRSLRHKITFVATAAIMYLIILLAFVSLGMSQPRASVAILVAIAVVAVIFGIVRPYWLVRDFKRHPNFARPVQLQINDAGLHSETEISRGETKWNAYIGYRETENLFLLFLGARLVDVIPKRAFSIEQLGEFRDLVKANLSMLS